MTEYTKPGYERYARSLVEEIVPEIERRGIRAEHHRRYRSVWGSSLGGVVSFYTVWQHPSLLIEGDRLVVEGSGFENGGNPLKR